MIYTSEQIISKKYKYYTNDTKWIDLDDIAIAINNSSKEAKLMKSDLLQQLGMDKEYELTSVGGRYIIIAKKSEY